ncbi:hypothetical protein D9619_004562 [Psilocybe cf. subviscida]|uniref:Deacetylase sirtuin-type domain-containing protein n=1 Tax=Psilocybe cf. subviscida TaxID=2480587 RepID=A0A8H5BQI9_9AGAR|nr:hypothetical protein D9619_004562 [Psilocybe cf. subviscida]
MTFFLPLDPATPMPPLPSFLVTAANPDTQLAKTIQAIMKAKRIVVICGAGISVRAGIPDFRSSEGLFQTIKRDNPKEAMSTGKELFDVSVFNSEQKTSLFCQMIAQLSDLSNAAQPTSFHHALRELDERGRLLRVYTQNIDAIEQKSGLSFGVPEFEGRRAKSRSKGKGKAPEELTNDNQPIASSSRLPSPPEETPRCIPLHGTLQSMHCQICNKSFPLQDYMPSLVSGQPPPCPECTGMEETRQLVGKRPRGIGKLRPSVVLYNEAHKDGEGVGDVVQKDLIGSSKGKGKGGADLLLVVGTSLKVPGTKRMVREFAKAVWSRGSSSKDESSTPGASGSGPGPVTPAPSPGRTSTADDETPPPKAIYLNLDFPVPTREWDGVFDAWIQGDAQQFADVLRAEIEKEARMKEVASERKRRRDEEAARANNPDHELPDLARMQESLGANVIRINSKVSLKTTFPSFTSPHLKRKPSGGDLWPKIKWSPVVLPVSPPYTPIADARAATRGPDSSFYSPDVDVDMDEDLPVMGHFVQPKRPRLYGSQAPHAFRMSAR